MKDKLNPQDQERVYDFPTDLAFVNLKQDEDEKFEEF